MHYGGFRSWRGWQSQFHDIIPCDLLQRFRKKNGGVTPLRRSAISALYDLAYHKGCNVAQNANNKISCYKPLLSGQKVFSPVLKPNHFQRTKSCDDRKAMISYLEKNTTLVLLRSAGCLRPANKEGVRQEIQPHSVSFTPLYFHRTFAAWLRPVPVSRCPLG